MSLLVIKYLESNDYALIKNHVYMVSYGLENNFSQKPYQVSHAYTFIFILYEMED